MNISTKKITGKVGKVFYRIYRILETSALLGLIVSIVFFAYERNRSEKEAEESAKRTEEVINNLLKIEQSLSTRYLGIFPNYLSHINELLGNANPEKPVVVFEDVLYYGILSGPNEFKNVVKHLTRLANEGSEITIVYYDTESRLFRRMIQEQRINQQYHKKMSEERGKLMRELRAANTGATEGAGFFAKADSIISEKYFAQTRKDDVAAFEKGVNRYLQPIFNAEAGDDSIFFAMDEVRRKSLDKPVKSITFKDYMNMFQGMTKVLTDAYKARGIETIALDEYLVMSCWLNDDKAVLAFPSKYSTDEIGFFSQDPAFSKYIFTMLEGVKNRTE